MNPVLSLVTGTRNRPQDIQRLVASIRAHTPMPWELVVSDASDEPVGEFGDRVRIIPERPRLGCTKGYNVAFRAATGKWVIWLNDDCTVMPGYAEAAIRTMEANPQFGLGALYYADAGTGQGYHINECEFGMIYANFGIISRELGEQVGWFDEICEMYGNDNSLAYRVLMAGKGITGIPEARIFHHSTQDAQRIANNDYAFRHYQANLLWDKYRPYLADMRKAYEQARMVTA